LNILRGLFSGDGEGVTLYIAETRLVERGSTVATESAAWTPLDGSPNRTGMYGYIVKVKRFKSTPLILLIRLRAVRRERSAGAALGRKPSPNADARLHIAGPRHVRPNALMIGRVDDYGRQFICS